MIKFYEDSAKDFLELASHQRLRIMLSLLNKPSKPSIIKKELNVTIQEISRNFDRLMKTGFLVKNSEGYYDLSTFGKTLCLQIPSIVFLSQNRQYFENHSLDNVPLKFRQRIAALVQGEHIKGFVKVQEQWTKIYKNANEYTYNVLSELPSEIIKLAIKNANEKLVEQFYTAHMKKGININIILNEKEAIICFPSLNGDADLSQAFFSNDIIFHEWCLDLFRYFWYESNPFNESKLNS